MITRGLIVSIAKGLAGAAALSAGAFVTGPRPVANISTISPPAAGDAALTGCPFE
jgi:hypothetical protein